LILVLLAVVGCGSSKRSSFGAGGAAGASLGESGASGSGGQGGTSAASGGAGGATVGLTGSGGLTSSGGVQNLGGSSNGGASGGMLTSAGGNQPSGGQGVGGMTSSAGSAGKAPSAGSGGYATVASALVTSTNGVWTTGTWTETSGATADVTVDDTSEAQTWEGFGGAFHEMGFNLLDSDALEEEALNLLFSADGARLTLARIPIGGSDYSLERYTLDDTGDDVIATSDGSNRPPADDSLSNFSIERDKQTLIPYIKGALAINPNLRFWAIPFTPPVWMKTGFKTSDASTGTAKRPSYFDGGTMKADDETLTVYAQYFVRFLQAYQGEGIPIDTIAIQNESTFEQNYPSCLWDKATYTTFVAQYLEPALVQANFDTKIMLGMLANDLGDMDIMGAVMDDPVAKRYVGAIGVEWNVLSKVETTPLTYGLPIWVTEHKCGNYPFIPSAQPATTTAPAVEGYMEPAPNDQSYAVETWWYIRDAINKAKVTAYTVPHLVLNPMGQGNDTSRAWSQDSLLVVDGGKITVTEAYYVVRHFSQFVDPGARVVATSGGDALAFKNPDGSLVCVLFSATAKSDYTVKIGGKELVFSVPANGWATIKITP
jgi:glucosylceramidase